MIRIVDSGFLGEGTGHGGRGGTGTGDGRRGLFIIPIGHLNDDVFFTTKYQEKGPEFENNRYFSVLLFLIVSCLVGTKTINVKQ